MPEHLYALHYTYPPDMLERRAPHREAHLAHIAAWYADGRVIIAGATGDPASGGLIVLRGPTPELAEQFAAADPYMAAGLIVEHRVEPYTVVTPVAQPGSPQGQTD
ncbi:MAG: hypothetical protein H6531_05800 [Actinobacteria bacterium]|nr:hypothetical protein [Thermoleophilia bacterium]MCB9011327.1 hypothetical protein [Actinomycetota bacterium]